MSRGPDAHTLLTRALLASAGRAGCAARIVAADWTRWASATFVGARHEIALEGDASAALDDWLAALPDAELDPRGHIVADLVVEGVSRSGDTVTARIEALTVEER